MERDTVLQAGASAYQQLVYKVSEPFKSFSMVDAIALGGSQTTGTKDGHSDIDLYVYTTTDVPLSHRQAIVNQLGASRADLNLTFWGPGDEWFDAETGIEVDVIYFDKGWMQDHLDQVLVLHQASLGYTTCFWHTVLNSALLFDRHGWFAALQRQCSQPYPEKLKRAILAKNHPPLRQVIPSYYAQIKKAIERQDLVSLNHRVAALVASYFEVLFALNELPHPGEKKLVRIAQERCSKLPARFKDELEEVLTASATGQDELLGKLDQLLDSLDQLLLAEGFDPARSLEFNEDPSGGD